MKHKLVAGRIRTASCIVAAFLAVASTCLASPHFLIDIAAQWHEALSVTPIKVSPLTSAEWGSYIAQWNSLPVEGVPYPDDPFIPADLYVYPGGADITDAGLVMVWQPTVPGSYSSAWKYEYGLDPDLTNTVINITVTAPQFDQNGNQINVVSFGIRDNAGRIRSWNWQVGIGNPIPWNVPTNITIVPAVQSVNAATPVASGFVNNPLFSLANSLVFIVDENGAWVGGPLPIPPIPPGGAQMPGLWNYWHNLIVTPTIPQKTTDPIKYSQPPVAIDPHANPPWFNGWDEKSLYQYRPIMADDWECTDERPITDVHWWGSFENWDQPDLPTNSIPQTFHIGIWTDVPKGPTGEPSHPGILRWEYICPWNSVTVNFAGYDKDPRGLVINESCFQFFTRIPMDKWFYQDPGPNGRNIYWLSIAAIYGPTPQYGWGWKTRPHIFMDDAVRITDVSPIWPPAVNSQWVSGTPVEYQDQSWDLAFELTTNEEAGSRDLGDAPDSYRTLSASFGPSHVWSPNLFLGAAVDLEGDGQPTAAADGDDLNGTTPDDEDGVLSVTGLSPGNWAQIQLNVSGNGMLDAWIDYTMDGDFADAGEQVFASQPVGGGVVNLGFLVPAWAASGSTYARLRLSSSGGLSYFGPATDGEVEDYVATILPKWQQLPDTTPEGIDVNATRDFILADDFLCNSTGAITRISIWGSWRADQYPFNDPTKVSFLLSLHKDKPASPQQPYSMPAEPLWYRYFDPTQFTATQVVVPNLVEGWMDPPTGYLRVGDHNIWKYTFDIQPGDFIQQGTEQSPVVYWLDVQAIPDEAGTAFGWKTSLTHWNDDAVWGIGIEPFNGPWYELKYPPGNEYYGQSIDLAFEIEGKAIDCGDAPDPSYPTLRANGGAFHIIQPGYCLGSFIDAEPDGQPSPLADRDDINGIPNDEDGVIFNGPVARGVLTKVTVTATAAGKLDAWIDFNRDGDWVDSGEQVFAGLGIAAGPNILSFTSPAITLPGPTYCRFRFSSVGGLVPGGLAPDGEVEDYHIDIRPSPVVITKADVKKQLPGTYVLVLDDIVTANFGNDGWYFEEPERYAGVGVLPRADGISTTWVVSEVVSCYGTVEMLGCELMIRELTSWQNGTSTIWPLGQTNVGSAGSPFGNQPGVVDILAPAKNAYGLNTIGLLVRLWGRCTCVDTQPGGQVYFWINDGSDLWDGMNHPVTGKKVLGVRVRVPGTLSTPVAEGSYYAVTGIMRTEGAVPACTRCLWPRDENDIRLF